MSSFFSINAFLLGGIVAGVMAFIPFAYEWMGKRLGIRVTEFGIFTPMFGKPVLHQTKRGHTRYLIGLGFSMAHVRYLAMLRDDFELLSPEERPYAYYDRPFSQKIWVRLVPFLVWTCVLLVCLNAVNPLQSMDTNAQDLILYLRQLVRVLFGDKSQWPEFSFYAKHITGNKNLLLFAVSVAGVLAIFSQLINRLTDSGSSVKAIRWLQSGIGFLGLGFLLYVYFWKLIPFVHTFYTWGQLFRYAVSYLIGSYVAGALMYFLRISTLPRREEIIPDLY